MLNETCSSSTFQQERICPLQYVCSCLCNFFGQTSERAFLALDERSGTAQDECQTGEQQRVALVADDDVEDEQEEAEEDGGDA